MSEEISLTDIRQAHDRIREHIHRTPVVTCRALDELAGCRLFFKCENLQKAGAFKSRGACNAVLQLDDDQAAAGVVTHSSGNHAAALARAAAVRNIPAHIVMPTSAPQVKIAAVRGYGATIHFCEPTLQAREQTAQQVQSETGAEFVHPFDDRRVIAGQATAAVELLEQCPQLDVLMTPVGGGGLLSGTCLSVQALRPAVAVWAAEPLAVDDAYRSWTSGSRQTVGTARSVADGLLTNLGELTFPIIAQHVAEFVLAGEDEIREAVRLIMTRAKLVVEPSAAVPLAGILANRERLEGRSIGVILSGGNLDLAAMADWPNQSA